MIGCAICHIRNIFAFAAGEKVYCSRHKPEIVVRIIQCSEDGCRKNASFYVNKKRYCKEHLPAGGKSLRACAESECPKTATLKSNDGSKYCKKHLPRTRVERNKHFVDALKTCGPVEVYGDGLLFAGERHDVFVKEADNYAICPFMRPASVILWTKDDDEGVSLLCATITAELRAEECSLVRL